MAESGRNLVGEFRIPVTKDQWKAQHLNANQRLHHQARNKKTQWWRALAAIQCRNARIPGLDRAHIEIWFRFPDNTRREVANLQPTSKAIVDGLVDAGLLPDDKDEWCVGPDNRRTWPNGPHEVVVRVFSWD
ncbi:hypothetical protein [Glutamicibacter sp. TV12E]|uniref:hypothetical protein n=1 Tax=Glutamicibacter sp. TV12E TaxID=3446362 RepID=UPI004033B809